jgi:flagellar biosynthesis/type III secretory pathway chaperone
MDSAALIDELEDMLAEERRKLVAGEIEALGRLAEAKEALLARLARAEPGKAALARLRRASRRNGELMVAASSGIRAALNRLASLTAGPPPLMSYDHAGRPRAIGEPAGSVSRRA